MNKVLENVKDNKIDMLNVSVNSCKILSNKYESLVSDIKITHPELNRFINIAFTNKSIKDNSVRYKGYGSHRMIYNFSMEFDFDVIYNDYYSSCWYNKKMLCILTYCEGDIFCEVFKHIADMEKAIDETVDFYKNMY